ncbi:acyltransferase family protein [Desertimonas flava]|uniref:acyltransferase family protein n=1 Tax=Desertimonas flava TaxID=2064846 RepID=UPI000E353534|nr:acyltransferase family protein [Desertimonas flava]
MIEDRPRTARDLTSRPLEWNPPRAAISRVPYLPGLDGMRAIAVVAVILYHTNNGWVPGGFIGVEVFFVISGYLITLLLIGEHEKTGHIDLKQFWLRRARRLLPALFLLLGSLMIYVALFKRDQLGNIRGDVIAGLTYVSNWYQIWVGQGYTSSLDFVPLRHLWSLAVEEQFYLVWPLVMVGLIRLGRRRLPTVALWLIGAAFAITLVTALLFAGGRPGEATNLTWEISGREIVKNDALYLSTITRASGLLIGAAFAMLWRPVAVMRGPLRNRGRELDVLAIVGMAGLVALAWKLHVAYEDGRGDPWLFRGGFLLVALCTLLVMAAVTHRGAAAGPILGNPVFNWIGTRSYGLYLFHWPIYQILREQAGKELPFNDFVIAMILTVMITEASYRVVETPVRKQQLGAWWRSITERSDPRPRQAVVLGGTALVALLGFSAVSMAGGDVKLNDVEASLAEAEDDVTNPGDLLATTGTTAAVTTAPVTPTVAPEPTTTVAGAPAPTTTVAAPTTTAAPPVPAGGMLALGDSVMRGAAAALKDIGFDNVVAEEGRQFAAEVELVQGLAASGALPQVVLVHLGTNGTIGSRDAEAFFTALKDVPLVVVLTLWMPNPKPWIAPNNEVIQGLQATYPNVRVGNWATFAPECDAWADQQGYQNDCYGSDGFHMGENGAEYYANTINYWVNQFKAELGLT